MLSRKDKKMINLFFERTTMTNFIESELLKLGFFMNNEEQRILIKDRYIIQYKNLELRSQSYNEIKPMKLQKIVRQHSF